MSVCGICTKKQSERTISKIPMCGECFTKLQKLRVGDMETIKYFADDNNLANATSDAKEYFKSLLEEKYALIEETKKQQEKEKEDQQHLAIREERKRAYANSFNEYYEYDVVTIINENHGTIDKGKMMKILSDHAKNGWKLHTMYSNELGKNALSVMGFGVNSTACEDVMIFERRVANLDE